MNPLRVVLVLQEAPAPFGGAAARWYYVLLRELVARGHRVTALAACSKPADADEARRLFPAPDYDLRLYPFPARTGLTAKLETLRRPYSYMFSRELKRDLEAELARGYDVFHLENIWAGWLGLERPSRTVLTAHSLYRIDLAGVPPGGLAARVRRRLLLRGERRLVTAFPRLITLSDRLRAGMLELNPRADVSVVPIGIDTSLYPYTPDADLPGDPVVSVIGSMNWYPTRSAAVRLLTHLWPGIKERVPNARLQLVGWGARAALRDYLGRADVSIEENVSDTRPYFERTGVLLYAPERGSGMKVKILEALAFGVPVVTTTEGVEGLPAADGVHAGVCDDDPGLIDRTVRLLGDPAAANRQRAAGRVLLEAHCGGEPTVSAVERVYARIAASAAAPARSPTWVG